MAPAPKQPSDRSPPTLDVERLTAAFAAHGVDYLVVGGVGALAHGAARLTADFDAVILTTPDNLARVADVLRSLHAHLRVEGLTDAEARDLPVQMDRFTLATLEISAWRTDAGDVDVLHNIPTRDGARVAYGDLVQRAQQFTYAGSVVTVAALTDIIDSKTWANRPKDRQALDELRRLARSTPSQQPPRPWRTPGRDDDY